MVDCGTGQASMPKTNPIILLANRDRAWEGDTILRFVSLVSHPADPFFQNTNHET